MKDEDAGISIAYDSQITSGHRIENSAISKVFKNGDLIIGVCGDLAFLTAVKFQKFSEVGTDPERWVSTYFAPKLKKIAKKLNTCTDATCGCSISYAVLVIADGVTFLVDDDSSVTRTTDGFHSVGSGSGFALGALKNGASAMEALEVAAHLDIFTGGDLHLTTAAELLDEPVNTGVLL
jgi:ATP-dependent protease HslVU (ClpYQ) peptidase subunit